MSFLDIIFVSILVFYMLNMYTNKRNAIFDRNTTSSLRGVAMLSIILGHICINCGYESPILHLVGFLFTGLFFSFLDMAIIYH